ncbi:MAG TPA: hypothetical protein VFU48_03455, partial [Nitrospira sp.]|nr:hypothetical protein [Nitrospira sp.]
MRQTSVKRPLRQRERDGASLRHGQRLSLIYAAFSTSVPCALHPSHVVTRSHACSMTPHVWSMS